MIYQPCAPVPKGGVVLGDGPGSLVGKFRVRLALPFEAAGFRCSVREDMDKARGPVIRCQLEDPGTRVVVTISMPAADLLAAKKPEAVCEAARMALCQGMASKNRELRKWADCWRRLKARRDARRKGVKTCSQA